MAPPGLPGARGSVTQRALSAPRSPLELLGTFCTGLRGDICDYNEPLTLGEVVLPHEKEAGDTEHEPVDRSCEQSGWRGSSFDAQDTPLRTGADGAGGEVPRGEAQGT